MKGAELSHVPAIDLRSTGCGGITICDETGVVRFWDRRSDHRRSGIRLRGTHCPKQHIQPMFDGRQPDGTDNGQSTSSSTPRSDRDLSSV